MTAIKKETDILGVVILGTRFQQVLMSADTLELIEGSI